MDKLTNEQKEFINDTLNIVKNDINFISNVQDDGMINVTSPLSSNFKADIILKYQRAFKNSSLPREKFIEKAAQEIKEMMELGY